MSTATDDVTDRGSAVESPTIESYETDDGVVFFDAQNPLAWVETSRTLVLTEIA
ncbi:DUF7331 family protein [Natrialba asiatica]|uniref:Uncharacterized protein n=1 Tax=Natrialba asiatica (strain ATCC 700177 / DSM 12278 / JCM 9576 / FERM P-10747 / NBRC 102637 / 172P1) TaxID=29540 RepID=M0AMX2_NATA1|nr:hypothetical protein [Natrialba asiatica]ELY99884.1 hypothetical protein C481_14338 [Natrialba asiatica DSM 12278]